jgi:hypothetical protein
VQLSGQLYTSPHTIQRANDNEFILFVESERASWIIYPPRSQYAHLDRPTPNSTIVEHHPWEPLSRPGFHILSPATGCATHGIECVAYAAVKAAAEAGWDAFK